MIKVRTQIFSFLAFLVPFFSSALANEFTLKIGTMDLPPYGWVDESGQSHGIIYEMLEEIGMRSGLPYENRVYPFNRMLKLLGEGEIDLVSSQAHKKALEAGDKLAVQHMIDVIAAVKKGSEITTLEGFKDKNLLYHHGASYRQLEGFPKHITYVKSYEESVNQLYSRERWSGAVFSEPAYYYFLQKAGLKQSDFDPPLYVERGKQQWVFVRKDFPEELRGKLSEIVTDIFNEGMYETLLMEYKR